MLVYRLLAAKWALKSIQERRLKVSILDELNDPFELLAANMRDRTVREFLKGHKAQLSRRYGVVCFSQSWGDPVLWSHYGDCHRGIALGFDVPDKRLMNVRYVAARTNVQLDQFARREPEAVKAMQHLLCTKYDRWKYESETRAWCQLEQPDDMGLYFTPFGDDLLRIT